eukprot:TRINITY_DN27326_c0_g1_i1.p1 TRINITY_DN27326_c0_g1~~TRINITY_DN27326_c0_g1_i1.p1  ORF type:complete len:115 (-),score=21.44 TRINITY_DN27326_c0_g1_i1:112-435(-)
MAKKHFSSLRNEWKNNAILLTRGFCAPILNQIRNINKTQEQHYKQNINQIFQQFPILSDIDIDAENTKENEMDSDELKLFKKHSDAAKSSVQRAVSIYKSKTKSKGL